MDSSPIFLIDNSVLNYLLIAKLLVLAILLVCSALISGAEVAFFSLKQLDLEEEIDKKESKLKVVELLKKPKKLLGTILIANNFVNILVVLLFADIGTVLFLEVSTTFRFFIEVILVTFLILLFGEVLPKVYATRKPMSFATFMSKPLGFLNVILTPFSSTLVNLTSVVEDKLANKNNNLSIEKLSQALELTSDEATTKDEQKILEGIVTFGNTETVQIMKPRTEVCAIQDNASFEEVLKIILKNGYSRNPVFHENIDTIVGVLYAKDLLAHIDKKQFKWQELLREAFYVPENKKLDDLLSDFQDMKNHMAIVVDEYGGTSGIVTLEDVIEEIVGDINDEFDDDDLFYSKLDDNNYVFEAKTTIKDFCKVLEEDEIIFEEEKGESETLAGFILEVFGKFPKRNQKINFNQYTFTIEVLDKKRIKRVKVTRHV